MSSAHSVIDIRPRIRPGRSRVDLAAVLLGPEGTELLVTVDAVGLLASARLRADGTELLGAGPALLHRSQEGLVTTVTASLTLASMEATDPEAEATLALSWVIEHDGEAGSVAGTALVYRPGSPFPLRLVAPRHHRLHHTAA
jgi:hypothetical protein